MDDQPDGAPSKTILLAKRGIATVIAGASGAALGWILATRFPTVDFAYTGFLMAPFFILLEAGLPPFIPLFGDRNTARLSLAGAFVAGFYAAWFGLRRS
ncbi:MAG: hypothetical protein HY823_04330 [Acidobacteria bacterium]|nr:hypothetical protein [Acidobacteriota bacterium]